MVDDEPIEESGFEMEKGYFSAAWGDITKSPGWFSKILRLGLLNLIPIFGVIVTYGYLYGWARDIAWNVHRPMPDRIFGNEDGNLYKRGFFILVIGFVCSLIPGVFSVLTSIVTGFSFVGFVSTSDASFGLGALLMGVIISLAGLVLTFAVVFFYWVGAMRCALYGTLSSGFQIGKIWAMMRYDFMGLLRIFGMSLICGCVVGIAAFIIFMLVMILGTLFGVAFVRNEAQAVAFVLIFLLFILLVCVATFFISVLIAALVARALGYWTRQFQVNLWGGQEDPMPFELEQARQSQQQHQTYQAQSYQQAQPYQSAQPQQPGSSNQNQQFYQTSSSNYQQPYQSQDFYQAGQQTQVQSQVMPQSVQQPVQQSVQPQNQQPVYSPVNQSVQMPESTQSSVMPQADYSVQSGVTSQSDQPVQSEVMLQTSQSEVVSQVDQPGIMPQFDQSVSPQAETQAQAQQSAEPPVIEVEPVKMPSVSVEDIASGDQTPEDIQQISEQKSEAEQITESLEENKEPKQKNAGNAEASK